MTNVMKPQINTKKTKYFKNKKHPRYGDANVH